jgi:hypothetical protein
VCPGTCPEQHTIHNPITCECCRLNRFVIVSRVPCCSGRVIRPDYYYYCAPRFPGDRCEFNEQCSSGGCQDGRCTDR